MYFITKQSDKTTQYVNELIADTVDDLQNINVNTMRPGTTCLVIEPTSVYILNTEKQWKQL